MLDDGCDSGFHDSMIFNDGMLSRRKKAWLQHTTVSANRDMIEKSKKVSLQTLQPYNRPHNSLVSLWTSHNKQSDCLDGKMTLPKWSKRLQKFDDKIFSFFTAQIAGIFLWLHEFRAIDDAEILRPILQNRLQVGCEMLHTGHNLGEFRNHLLRFHHRPMESSRVSPTQHLPCFNTRLTMLTIKCSILFQKTSHIESTNLQSIISWLLTSSHHPATRADR